MALSFSRVWTTKRGSLFLFYTAVLQVLLWGLGWFFHPEIVWMIFFLLLNVMIWLRIQRGQARANSQSQQLHYNPNAELDAQWRLEVPNQTLIISPQVPWFLSAHLILFSATHGEGKKQQIWVWQDVVGEAAFRELSAALHQFIFLQAKHKNSNNSLHD